MPWVARQRWQNEQRGNVEAHRRVSELEARVDRLERKWNEAMSNWDRIRAAVERTEGVSASTQKYIQDLGAYIRQISNDPVELGALADRLEKNADQEVAAVLANPVPGTVIPDAGVNEPAQPANPPSV